MMTDSNKFRLNSRINIRHKSFKKNGFEGHHPQSSNSRFMTSTYKYHHARLIRLVPKNSDFHPMDLTSLLIGAAIGLVLAYILFYLLHKSNSVAKQDYDTLVTKLNDTVSTLKLTEDRLKSQQNSLNLSSKKLKEKNLNCLPYSPGLLH